MNAAFQVEGVRLALERDDDRVVASEFAALRRQVESDGGMTAEDALALIDVVSTRVADAIANARAEVEEAERECRRAREDAEDAEEARDEFEKLKSACVEVAERLSQAAGRAA